MMYSRSQERVHHIVRKRQYTIFVGSAIISAQQRYVSAKDFRVSAK